MPEPKPRISALIVARDEAEDLPGCLESLSWADETVVVVDAASRDRTEAIARRLADKVAVRAFDDFAGQRNASLALASGDWVFAVDADERATPDLAIEIRRALADPTRPHDGYRVPIRSVVLGRSFRYSGTQHDLPLRLFRRDRGRWVGQVHETVDLRGTAGQLLGHLTHRTISDMHTFLRKIDHYTTLEAAEFHREGRPFRVMDLTLRPAWVFAKLYLGKQGFRDGLEGLAFCALSGLSAAVRSWKLRELIRAGLAPGGIIGGAFRPLSPTLPDPGGNLTTSHDAYVAARFDESEARFKAEVASDDVRLRAVLESLGPLEGRRILDLGCGKGRFAAHLAREGARVIGIDLSAAMLASAKGLDRIRASAKSLPFADGTFDAVVAIEVLEHVGEVGPILDEARRVLKPGGRLAIVDKNAGALDARRPWLPSLLVKWVDERRGLWMYPGGGPVRERWFPPRRLKSRLRRDFEDVRVAFLLRPEEVPRLVFRAVPSARLMTLWSAKVPERRLELQPDLRRTTGATWPRPPRELGSTGGCPSARTPAAPEGSDLPLEDLPRPEGVGSWSTR